MIERTCRACGCTELRACVDWIHGRTCHWVDEDLCSACVGKPAELLSLGRDPVDV